MKHYLLFVFLILLNIKSVRAEVEKVGLDTSIDKSNYKQSKQFFLENYGKDDTAKALINYFFRKRKTAFYQTVIPIVVGGALTILLIRALNKSHSPVNVKDDYGGLVFGGALVTVVLQSAGQIVDGQITWLLFSRHKLFALLKNYNSGKPLPKRLKRRRRFQQQLENLKT